jgi:hypothetical protein
MTDQTRAEVNRYAQLDPIARALVDDHDQIALAAMLVKAQDDLAYARAALVHNGQPGTRWLHIAFTSPDDTSANTSALNLRDHLRAEFDAIGMRITTNATEAESVIVCTTACDEQHTYDWTCEQFAGIDNGKHPARTTPNNPSCSPGAEETGPNNPAATEATDVGNRPDAPAWTPPPPGSTAEQLPEGLLALIRDRLPDYTSTACQTADALACTATYRHPQYDEIRENAERLHSRCRTNQKFTGQLCACGCHLEERQS